VRAQTSFVIAMIMPISTNTTIAICVQIQNGDIPEAAYLEELGEYLRRPGRPRLSCRNGRTLAHQGRMPANTEDGTPS